MADRKRRKPARPRYQGRIIPETGLYPIADPSEPQQRKKALAIDVLALVGNVGAAMRAVGHSRTMHNYWCEMDETYAQAAAQAKIGAVEALEAEAHRRAFVGWLEPVYQGGKEVGQVRKFDSTLLIFLLNGAAPEKYRRRLDVRTDTGEPAIKAYAGVDLDRL
jgi:hypothetical protein